MIYPNKTLAKIVSKVFTGKIGMFIHFFILMIIIFYTEFGLLYLASNINPNVSEFLKNTNPSEYTNIYKIIMVVPLITSFIFTMIAKKIYNEKKLIKDGQSFGKARFAHKYEIKEKGLIKNKTGIVFGKIKKHLCIKPENVEGHTLIVGGTGTGKTRGIVLPTLFKWSGSALVMDIKGELSNITSKHRELKNKIYIFDPTSQTCDCYNPIAYCDSLDKVQSLARTLIPSPQNSDSFWSESAQSLLSAYIFEGYQYNRTLSYIAERLCTTPIKELIEHCRISEIREVRILASTLYDTPEKTLGGIMAELKRNLITIATDKNIIHATSRSDWSPSTLEENATIYLKVSEHLLVQYKDLWTVIINQILRHLSNREERKKPPILIALDELPRLSKIHSLVNALSTLRSRNVQIMGIIQSMAQLDSIYGQNSRKIIADNCSFKMILNATDPDTQRYFSNLTGNKTSYSKSFTGNFIGNVSKSEQSTPLIRPEEWANLEKPILLAPRLYPIQLDFAYWDKDKTMNKGVVQ